MKQLLLTLFSFCVLGTLSAQDDCPDVLVCTEKVTVSIAEQQVLFGIDLLENGEEYTTCDNTDTRILISLFDTEGNEIKNPRVEIALDCDITAGQYLAKVSEVSENEESSNPIHECWTELTITGSAVKCIIGENSYDINVLLDCSSEDVLKFNGGQTNAEPGQNICIPFKTSSIESLAAIQTDLSWDSEVLEFTNFVQSDLPTDIHYNEISEDGQLRVVWLPGGENLIRNGHDLVNDAILFELCFNVIGSAGESTLIYLVEGMPIEFIQVNPSVPPGLPESARLLKVCQTPALVNIGEVGTEAEYTVSLNDENLELDNLTTLNIPTDKLIDGTNTIKFEPNNFDNYIENISTLDLVLGLKMFVIDEPVDPLRTIALDVDYSGGINVKDLVLMRRLILGIDATLPHPGFFFVESEQIFDNTFDIFNFGYFDSYSFEKEDIADGLLKFKAFKYGDLSVHEFHNNQTEVRSSEENIFFENKFLIANSPTTVKFTIDGRNDFKINGFQSSLNLDGISIKEVKHNYGASEFMSHITVDERLNLVYASLEPKEKIEFELVLESEESGLFADKISLNNQYEDELVKDDLSTTKLSLEALTVASKEFRIVPNPFNISTTLSIPREYLGGDLIISNVLGNKIHKAQITDESITLVRSIFNSSGIYLITLEAGNRTMTRRILLQE